MKQILDYMPLDIVPHPEGFVIIEPDKKDDVSELTDEELDAELNGSG